MNRQFAVAALLLGAMLYSTAIQADVGVGVSFSKNEIQIIAEWRQHHGDWGASAGRGKKSKGLPPGIARNLARGKALPPGIAKQVLPTGLTQMLPPAPRGFERIIVDGKVLLVEIATRVVHDILTDVILRS